MPYESVSNLNSKTSIRIWLTWLLGSLFSFIRLSDLLRFPVRDDASYHFMQLAKLVVLFFSSGQFLPMPFIH